MYGVFDTSQPANALTPVTTAYANPGLAQTLAASNAAMAKQQAWIKEVNSRPPVTADMSPKVAAGRSVSAYSAPITPSAAQAGAISGNATAAASSGDQSVELAKKAAQNLNPVAATEFYKALGAALPGYKDMVGKMMSNTMSALSRELPPDVVNLIKMQSGERQQQGALASTARNLGLTSLQRSDAGQTMGTNLLNLAKNNLTAPTYDVFSGYQNAFSQLFQASSITPYQQGSLALQAQQNETQRESVRGQLAHSNAQLNWDKELSATNFKYQKEQDLINQNLAQQKITMAKAFTEKWLNAGNIMQRVISPGGGKTGLEDLAHLGGSPSNNGITTGGPGYVAPGSFGTPPAAATPGTGPGWGSSPSGGSSVPASFPATWGNNTPEEIMNLDLGMINELGGTPAQ